jgi:hypothetical protein
MIKRFPSSLGATMGLGFGDEIILSSFRTTSDVGGSNKGSAISFTHLSAGWNGRRGSTSSFDVVRGVEGGGAVGVHSTLRCEVTRGAGTGDRGTSGTVGGGEGGEEERGLLIWEGEEVTLHVARISGRRALWVRRIALCSSNSSMSLIRCFSASVAFSCSSNLLLSSSNSSWEGTCSASESSLR